MNIVVIAFNIEIHGYANGPGICLYNFLKIMRGYNHNINVYCKLPTIHSESINSKFLLDNLKSADFIIFWSGLDSEIIKYIIIANKLNKKILLGPNLIDTVYLEKEKKLLNKINFNKILTVNNRLKFLVSRQHNISLDKISTFMVGPDLELWTPIQKDRTILWKGNGRQPVKDLKFALELKKSLPQYQFNFIGADSTYNYFEHINQAKKSRIQILTSWSETMGLAGLEGMAAGIPAISHPEVFVSGINYETGIITSKTIENFKKAIIEIMEDENLYEYMVIGAQKFIKENFSSEVIHGKFLNIIKEIK